MGWHRTETHHAINIFLKSDISKNYLFENIQLVIFDKDGTITDINKYWSYVISQRANYFGEKYKNALKNRRYLR